MFGSCILLESLGTQDMVIALVVFMTLNQLPRNSCLASRLTWFEGGDLQEETPSSFQLSASFLYGKIVGLYIQYFCIECKSLQPLDDLDG